MLNNLQLNLHNHLKVLQRRTWHKMLVCNIRKHDTNDDRRALFLPACLFALVLSPLNFMKKYDQKCLLHFLSIKFLLPASLEQFFSIKEVDKVRKDDKFKTG